MKNLLAIAFILFGLGQAWSQDSTTLKVVVKKFDSAQGTVKIALYNSEETYMGKAFIAGFKPVDNKNEMELMLGKIPTGKYAFSIYHDENGNDKLDTNLIGIPTEDYAFSNNADGRFGPPNYEECEFEVSGTELVQIININ
ncbi:MAG: DUF2141 domain-containing protein [Cyclobacteriaceae bacterium]